MFLLIFIGYFVLLTMLSYLSGRGSADSSTWFMSGRDSSWWMVAIGMIGSSISGVSFVSVPGMVAGSGYNYMWMVAGFFFGYLIIAYVLLPVYYRLELTSIYSYLASRFGIHTQRTTSILFIISKLLGTAISLYAVAMILQMLIFDAYHIPFVLTAVLLVGIIWCYTFRSGIRSIIRTDILQTACMVGSVALIVWALYHRLDMTQEPLNLSNYHVSQPWWRSLFSFLSGVFIPVVMTGLDQDKMQKNLTCRNLSEAQRNMVCYGIAFVPINMLLLILGALMYRWISISGLSAETASLTADQLLPYLSAHHLGQSVAIIFALGLTAAAFSSADSALASLTTSVHYDLSVSSPVRREQKKPDKPSGAPVLNIRTVHATMCGLLALLLIAIHYLNNRSLLDAIYTLVSYGYGPILGMYIWGLYTHREVSDKWVPMVMIASPILCYVLSQAAQQWWGYRFGYEILLINAAFTLLGCTLLHRFATASN